MKEWSLSSNNLDNKNTNDLGQINASKELRDLKLEMEWLMQKSSLDTSLNQAEKDKIKIRLSELEDMQALYLEQLALSQKDKVVIEDDLESIKSSIVYTSSKYEANKWNTLWDTKEKADIARNKENRIIEDLVQSSDFRAPQFLKNIA